MGEGSVERLHLVERAGHVVIVTCTIIDSFSAQFVWGARHPDLSRLDCVECCCPRQHKLRYPQLYHYHSKVTPPRRSPIPGTGGG